MAQKPFIGSGLRGGLALVARMLLCAGMLVVPAIGARAADVTLPVPRVTIYPGDTISDAMLVERQFRGPDFDNPGFAAFREAVVGKVSRQTLLPNQPISLNGIRDPFAVQQGQAAVVVFQSGGLVIAGTAIPLQAGSVGELISLRNVDSGTTIRGVVQKDGTVRVGMP
jgi:flagella basal body P-ring formation protein FlgA